MWQGQRLQKGYHTNMVAKVNSMCIGSVVTNVARLQKGYHINMVAKVNNMCRKYAYQCGKVSNFKGGYHTNVGRLTPQL